MLLIEYPKCSTCQKAEKFLDNHHISYEKRLIKEETPTKEELSTWIKKYGIDRNKLWNTSGIKYRELNQKVNLKSLSEEEQLSLLEKDGMLIKRPLLITDDKMIIGFKEQEYLSIIEK